MASRPGWIITHVSARLELLPHVHSMGRRVCEIKALEGRFKDTLNLRNSIRKKQKQKASNRQCSHLRGSLSNLALAN